MAKRGSRVLEVRLSHGVSEMPTGIGWGRGGRAFLYQIERAVRTAKEDPKTKGLYLELDALDIGWSKAASLHRAVMAFRGAGKPTVALVYGATNAAFLLASACETVVLHPGSILHLQSLSSESFFFKDVLGDLGVTPEIDHVGEFKSAGEAFTRRSSSEEHRLETKAILTDLQEKFVERVAEGRGQDRAAIARAIAEGPYLAEDALARGLVDRVDHADTCKKLLEEELGSEPRFVPYLHYRVGPRFLKRLLRWRRPRVAVLYACGVITSGEGRRSPAGPSAVGARSFSELLEKVRSHPRVKAVVVRVESPGGSAVASDAIHRELALTAKEKPLVVSMGDVAASGGYFMAAPAHAVVAEATTLTGSIGVIGGKFVVKGLLDRLGVHRETHAVGENAGFGSPLRPFTEKERAWHQRYLREFYEKRFIPVVAAGRKLSFEQADAAGRGRVWTGAQAREVGLVDVLGGLDEAVDLAHEKAGLRREKARVDVYVRRPRLREMLGFGAAGAWSPLAGVLDSVAVLQEIAREDLLLLMPRLFRIR